jgi:hypothetical protein
LIRRKVVRYNGNSPIPESFALQSFQISLKCGVFNSPHNCRNNSISVNGLDKEVIGACLHRLHGAFGVTICRQHDHRNRTIQSFLPHRLQHIEPALRRHTPIAQRHVGRRRVQNGEGLFPV